MYNYLIIGQGLAGTLVAYEAMKRGKRIMVLDNEHQRTASRIAAGIINPITGRRFVKSWQYDTLFPAAKMVYRELEQLLGISIFKEQTIARILFNIKEENEFYSRSAEPTFAQYLTENATLDAYQTIINTQHEVGEILGAKANLPLLVKAFQLYLKEKGCFQVEQVTYDKLTIKKGSVIYKGIEAEKVIFCEGIRAEQNPYFNYLPFNGAKGDVLIIRIPNFKAHKILKHKLFLVPLKKDIFWVGSNYIWDYKDDLPTSKGRIYLEKRLQKILSVPFEIVEHRAAIRPTVKDRRPFIGQHPELIITCLSLMDLVQKALHLSPILCSIFLII